ncbi:single-stranded DNA-binding protein [Portibacter lacus]|uniref:Single-stranded DNA-binding protein n=1 Tax=Portibacter lacus TaxID=1099794 RepID=A0AA37SNP9_9BACT|nr:single-stranded DNA-binding protein [Portibacter lacus]GLR16864.1 single-stranded DNA-binding protein [Portibacter lacus]
MYNLNNSVRLTGHLGKDIEFITLESGAKIAKTTIATNSFYTNKQGEKIQEVEWHNIVAWNKTAELMQRFLKKGSKVTVEGMLKNESYKNKDGEMKYFTNVKINNFNNLTPKEEEVKAEAMPF